MRLQVRSLASLRGFRILRCCGCGVAGGYSSDSTPSLETSIGRGSGPRKKDKKKKEGKEGEKKKKERGEGGREEKR